MVYVSVAYVMWSITYTMMDIPYWSMIPALTKGGKEREGLTNPGPFLCWCWFSTDYYYDNDFGPVAWRR